jgi:hypothetical protein
MNPGDGRMAMMREVQMIVEKQCLDPGVNPQIPGAFDGVELRKRMVRVLKRTPLHGESCVTGKPARQ